MKQLISELTRMRRRVAEQERAQTRCQRVNEVLRESEKRFKSFFEKGPAYCYMVSPKGLILDVNKTALRALGYKKNELVGQSLKKVYGPESLGRMRDNLAEWKKTGKLRNKEMIIISKNGGKRTVLLNAEAVKDKKGKILHSISIQQDITGRKRTKERIDHLNGVLLTIRNVARVIMRRKARDLMLKDICDNLIKTRVYYNAWIALLDDSGNILTAAEAGLGRGFSPLVEQLKGGDHPACVRKALNRSKVVVIKDPESECPECPLSYGYRGRTGMSVRLKYGNDVYGIMTVSVPPGIPEDKEEQALFKGVAGDIAFALYNLGVFEDRRRAEEALERSEERYALAQRAANIGSWDWDIRTGNLSWSDRIESMFGFGRGEFGATYEAFLECVHPEDRRHVIDSVNACVEGAEDYAIEHRIVYPDGTVRWVSETGEVIRDNNGKAIRMLGIVQDITERKRTKEADDLKKFSEMLINFQEEERRRVSRELHDEIGQILTAIKLNLRMITKDHAGLEELVQWELQKAIDLVDRAEGDVRRISARLRPAVLDDFGLIPSIEHEVDFLSERSGIKIEFTSRGLKNRIDPQKEIALYRVVQEALTNIIRHSDATSAKVSVAERGKTVLLKIADNGKGLKTSGAEKSRGQGVLGMRERIALVGGNFTISSRSEGGTVLEAEVPLP